jgi:hypothetical protein
MGQKRFASANFLSPGRGSDGYHDQAHGFTVGYCLTRLRRWGNLLPMLVRNLFQADKVVQPTSASREPCSKEID